MSCKEGVYSGSSDKTIRKWEVGKDQPTKQIDLLNNCYALAISKDEKTIVSGGLSKDITLHDLVAEKDIILVGHSFRINSLDI